ncbi:MAG: hypothetical protein R2787_06735 [Saprospiraceae bacterium]
MVIIDSLPELIGINDVAVTPDGDLYLICAFNLVKYDVGTKSYIKLPPYIDNKSNHHWFLTKMEHYIQPVKELWSVFDKTTGQHTEVMPLPANISPTHDLTFYKGKLYLSGGDLNTLIKNIIYEIDLTNPGNNKIVAVLDLKGTTQALTTIVDDCQNEHVLLCGSYTPPGVYELNMVDFTYSMVCSADFGKIGATSPAEFLP